MAEELELEELELEELELEELEPEELELEELLTGVSGAGVVLGLAVGLGVL